jgi:hypothetical protein
MKVRLDVNDRTLTMVSPDELIHFNDEFQARAFLTMFLADPGNMHTLRDLLGEQYGQFTVSGLTEEEVLNHVARLISRTCVGLVRVELRDMIAADGADGAAEVLDHEADETALSEQESEVEELKPEPQIPPLFPIIAKLEADGIDWERRKYNIKLDLMRYSGLDDPGASEVADTLVEVAAQDSTALVEEAEGFSNSLLGIADVTDVLDKKSELSRSIAKTAEEAGEDLESITDKNAQTIAKRLLSITPEPAGPSSMAPFMQDFSEGQGTAVAKATETSSATLGRLLENDVAPADPSQMANMLQEFGVTQGQGVETAAKHAAEDLGKRSGDLTAVTELPSMAGSLNLAAMNTSVDETGAGVIAATKGIALGLSRFVPQIARLAAKAAQGAGDESDSDEASATTGAADGSAPGVAGDTGAAGAAGASAAGAAADGAAEMAADGMAAVGLADAGADGVDGPILSELDQITKKALDGVKPPAWIRTPEGKTPETLQALEGSLREQTGGVIRATWDAVTYLKKLAPPLASKVEAEAAAAEAAAAEAAAAEAAAKAASDDPSSPGYQTPEPGSSADGASASPGGGSATGQGSLSRGDDIEVTAGTFDQVDPNVPTFDTSTVTDANGTPSMLGTEIKQSVLTQGNRIVEFTAEIGAGFSRLAPKVAPRPPAAPRPPTERTEHFTTTWVVPEPPPTPEWEAPEVETPIAFDGLGPEKHFEARLAATKPDDSKPD